MKPQTFVALLGLALIVFGVIWGVTPKSASVAGNSVECGMPFSSSQRETAENSASLVAALSGTDYTPGTVTSACESAQKQWLTWTSIALGAVLLAGSMVVARRQPSDSPAT